MHHNKSAVLLIMFNRPGFARKVFEAIKRYQPANLYLAADGPRPGVAGEAEKCAAVRQLADEVDWPCTVKRLYHDTNLGCKAAVSGAISWFFAQEEEGIILEDDCLPGDSFFTFCHTLLQKYRDDNRVMHIAGTNLQFGQQRSEASYYFSSIASIWGWASWKRVWANYDKEMRLFEPFEQQHLMEFVFPDAETAQWATNISRAVYEGKVDTWDYQLAFSIIINNGLCITPNTNLVSNIGFQKDSRLTNNPDDVHANIPAGEIQNITHPVFFIPNRQADIYQLSLSMPAPAPVPLKISLATRVVNKTKRSIHKIFSN